MIYRTKTGKILTEEDIDALADEAERGYDVSGLIGKEQSVGALAILDRTAGDKTIGWDPNAPDEIEDAQASFDHFKAKGYLAYRVSKEGTKTGVQLTKFDPSLERIIMIPPLVGG